MDTTLEVAGQVIKGALTFRILTQVSNDAVGADAFGDRVHNRVFDDLLVFALQCPQPFLTFGGAVVGLERAVALGFQRFLDRVLQVATQPEVLVSGKKIGFFIPVVDLLGDEVIKLPATDSGWSLAVHDILDVIKRMVEEAGFADCRQTDLGVKHVANDVSASCKSDWLPDFILDKLSSSNQTARVAVWS